MSKKIIDLASNICQIEHSKEVKQVLEEFSVEDLASYSENTELIEKLAEFHNVPEEFIELGYGGKEILTRLFRSKSINKILLPKNSFHFYTQLGKALGKELVYFELDENLQYDKEIIIKSIKTHNPDIVLINTPNNPTGGVLDYLDIINISDSFPKTTFILDEVYREFSNKKETDNLPFLNLNLGTVRSFSKSYNLPGLRIGYEIYSDSLRKKIKLDETKKIRSYLGYLSTFQEKVALAALDSKDHYENTNKELIKGRSYVSGALKSNGFKVYPSGANFILVEVEPEYMKKLKVITEEVGIKLRYLDKGYNMPNHVRITLGNLDIMKDVVDIFYKLGKPFP